MKMVWMIEQKGSPIKGLFGCSNTGVLKFSPRCANGAKHGLMRANLGLMDSNDQLAIIYVIRLTISSCLVLHLACT